MYACVFLYNRNVRKIDCAIMYAILFVILKSISTTQDEYDITVVQNHRYYGKQLICKECRDGDGRVDRNLYYCDRCNAFKDKRHFPKMSVDNWKRRGKREGVLKCMSNAGQPKDGNASAGSRNEGSLETISR